MNACLVPAADWAQEEFGAITVQDIRHKHRIIQIGEALAKGGSSRLARCLPAWKDLKAADRVFERPNVTFEAIAESHWQKTRQLLRQPGEYLWIEDTTTLDFTRHNSMEGLGRVGNDEQRGLFLHTALVCRVEGYVDKIEPQISIEGLGWQSPWVRPPELLRGNVKAGCEKKTRRFGRERESQRWGKALESLKPCPEGSTCIFIGDREADIYELFGLCDLAGFDFVIRANQARAFAEKGASVFSAVAKAPLLGRLKLKLRTRPGQPARVAELELRQAEVELRTPYRPGEKLKPYTLRVIEVREILEHQPVPVEEPLHWVLLTSLSTATLKEVRRVIAVYTHRWLVEEYFKVLKTGLQIESSQLRTRERFEPLLGICCLVALRLLGLKLLAQSEEPIDVQAEEFGPELLVILEAQFGKALKKWTYSSLLLCVAKMGGFIGRKGDGAPGWQTIWRGWSKLMTMVEGMNIMKRQTRFG